MVFIVVIAFASNSMASFGFKKWKSERRNIFAEAQFQEDLFPKNHQFSKFFPVLYLLAFVF